ncbi:TonB-dependent Receptor Plug Domain protein [compost metagenome]
MSMKAFAGPASRRLLGGSGLLLALFGLPVAAQESGLAPASETRASVRHFDIPGQPLSSALLAFGKQSGLQVSVDSQLLGDRQAPAVRGEMSSEQALGRLLDGSGLTWRYTAHDVLLLEPAPRPASGPLQLGSTQVRSQALVYQGETTLDRKTIEALPAGNGDITSLLKTNPNVQFDDAQLSSKTPGEIAPANVSINGAKFYQNAFLVDGVNMNNDIDPAQDNPNLLADVPGRSQGLALDTDLLESIKVYDSNVPAAYGRFNGGVIEAITRKPSKELHGQFSTQTTRSSWTNYHIDERQQQSFENSGSFDEQPEFEKVFLRGTLEGHLTEDFGLLANFSQKRSTIPLSFYSANNVEAMGYHKEKQRREIDNYFLKAVWQTSERLALESSVTYAPEENHYFRANAANSGFDTQSGGTQVNFKATWDGDLARVEQNLAWSRLELSRDSDYDDWFTWRKSEAKNWGVGNTASTNSLEGGYGDIEQLQNTWQYRLKADWRAFSLLGLEHRLQSGLELSEQYVRYERLTESSTYVSPASTSTCTNASGVTDTVACSLSPTVNGWPGQFMRSRTRFTIGDFDFTSTEWALFLQDEIAIDRLTLRPGVRVDNDNYMEQTTVAPRFAAEYDLFADRSTLLTAGVNRYYGRNITSWQLQDGRNRLRFTDSRTTLNAPWTTTANATNLVRFNRLDIPYDDEWMLGVTQQFGGLEFGLKYVKRKGRDQIVRVTGAAIGQPSTDPTLSNTYTTYTNAGKSETDILTLTATPLRDFAWRGTHTSGQLALDWTDSESSSPSYIDEYDEYVENDYIQYEGKFIRYADRPADNYNRPWTARLTTITDIPRWNLSWSNFLRYRAGYRKVGDTGRDVEYQGNLINVWEEREYGAALTWDTRLGWELPTFEEQALFVNVDVFNVLDKKSVNFSNSVNSTGIPTYEVGRQFWLEVGYRF